MKRKQLSILMSGSKGTGKTTVLLNIAKQFAAQGVKICFVYNGTGEIKISQFKQIKIEEIYSTPLNVFRINYSTKNLFFERLEKITKPKPGIEQKRIVLIFDDGMYFLKGKDFNLENIFRTQRQRNLELIFVTHGVSEIPAMFWGFFNTLFLFKTSDKATRNLYKIPDYIIPEVEEVNRKAATNNYYYKIIYL